MTTHAFQGAGLGDAELIKKVGRLYHCGLAAAVGAAGATQRYGYMLEPSSTKEGGFHWKTDVATKQALIAYSSQQLIDRDLAFFPRITDADFSKGGFQEVWLDPAKYFDSDMDPRIPGFLQLRPQWTRATKAGITAGANFSVVSWKSDFWFSFGQANGNIYSASGGTTTSPVAAGIVALDTDGTYLYAGTGAQLYRSLNGTTWTAVTSSINGTASQWWVINQGTNGYFAYYQSGSNLLYKIDLTQTFPIASAAEPQIPVGANAIQIVDLSAYQTSIAILTTDVNGPGSDVWYFDGNNLTRVIRIEGYGAQGMCNALGALYVGGFAVGKTPTPKLFQVDAGNYNEVVIPGSPFPAAAQSCLQPRAQGRYVYWPITNPSIKGISIAPAVVIQYDVLTGAAFKLPTNDATDFTTLSGSPLRNVALLGDNVAVAYVNGTNGIVQYQQTAFGTIKYQTTGWLASSHIDFGTPAVSKRFRLLEVHHAPLNAGEQIFVEVFVDQDPLSFTTTLAPVPATQTGGTNSTAGSTLTSLLVGSDTVGKTLYFAVRMTAGTANNTTPRISYISVEVGGTWVAELPLVCTAKRQLLSQEADDQGASGGDLAYLLFLAYEQGALVTFYHPNQQKYSMAVESLDGWNPSPNIASKVNQPVDEEYAVVMAILRQT
jgi:hypothetical protein